MASPMPDPIYPCLRAADVQKRLHEKRGQRGLRVLRDPRTSGGFIESTDRRLIDLKMRIGHWAAAKKKSKLSKHGFIEADPGEDVCPDGWWRFVTSLAGFHATPFFVPAYAAADLRQGPEPDELLVRYYTAVAEAISIECSFESPYFNNFASAGLPYPVLDAGVKMMETLRGLETLPKHYRALATSDRSALTKLASAEAFLTTYNAMNHRFQPDGADLEGSTFRPKIRKGQTFDGQWIDADPRTPFANQFGMRDRPNQAGNSCANGPKQVYSNAIRKGIKRRALRRLAKRLLGQLRTMLDTVKPQELAHLVRILSRLAGKPFVRAIDYSKFETSFTRTTTLAICVGLKCFPPQLRLHLWFMLHSPLLVVDWNPETQRWGWTGDPGDPASYTRDGGNPSGDAFTDLMNAIKGIADMLYVMRRAGIRVPEPDAAEIIAWMEGGTTRDCELLNLGDDNLVAFNTPEELAAFDRACMAFPYGKIEPEIPPKFAGYLVCWTDDGPAFQLDPRRYVSGLLEPERGVDSRMRREFAGPAYHDRNAVFSDSSPFCAGQLLPFMARELENAFGAPLTDAYQPSTESSSTHAIQEVMEDPGRLSYKYDPDDIPEWITDKWLRRMPLGDLKRAALSNIQLYEAQPINMPNWASAGIPAYALSHARKHLHDYTEEYKNAILRCAA